MANFFWQLKSWIKHKKKYLSVRRAQGRDLVKGAKKTDIYGCGDLLQLIDGKLAIVEKAYEKWDIYVDQAHDLRNIRIVRALIKRYQDGDFFEYILPEDGDFTKRKYVCKVYVNPKTIDKILLEMDPTRNLLKNEEAVQWYKTHLEEVYTFKLNRLIWNILRDYWRDFDL